MQKTYVEGDSTVVVTSPDPTPLPPNTYRLTVELSQEDAEKLISLMGKCCGFNDTIYFALQSALGGSRYYTVLSNRHSSDSTEVTRIDFQRK